MGSVGPGLRASPIGRRRAGGWPGAEGLSRPRRAGAGPAARRCPGGVRGGRGPRRAAGRVGGAQARCAASARTRVRGDRRGRVRVLNDEVLRHVLLTDADMAAVETAQRAELQRRVERYRAGRERVSLRGRVVLIVDDGFATGATARAACLVARAQGAAEVVLAAPIGSADTVAALRAVADDVVCLGAPATSTPSARVTATFRQTSDEEVCECWIAPETASRAGRSGGSGPAAPRTARQPGPRAGRTVRARSRSRAGGRTPRVRRRRRDARARSRRRSRHAAGPSTGCPGPQPVPRRGRYPGRRSRWRPPAAGRQPAVPGGQHPVGGHHRQCGPPLP